MNYALLFQKLALIFSTSINQLEATVFKNGCLKKIMKVTDLNGDTIEVTHLEKAIKIADQYRKYQHKDKSYSDFDKRQKDYWTDIYDKLLVEQGRLNNIKKI